jgi:nucleoside-diphosphate-sugar epimerase
MDKIRGKRILITGGNGFLGSYLADSLKTSGAEVHILKICSANHPNEHIADLNDLPALTRIVEKTDPHIIYHLAAVLNRERSFDHHEQIMKVNYFGTINLLKALQKTAYENFIFTSTSEVYGSNPAPFHENQIPDPATPYSLSKIFAEQAIKTYSAIYNKNFTILRLFNIFGRNMPKSFFIPQLIHSLKENIPFDMTAGEQIRDFVYIDDVVSALIHAADVEKPANDVFNVCSGKGTTLKDLAIILKHQINKDCIINFGKLPYRLNEIWNMVGDNSKTLNELGFSPQYTIEEALELLI